MPALLVKMIRLRKPIFFLIFGAFLTTLLGLLLLPFMLPALPGRYRVRLPAFLLAQITTPLPPALPTPKHIPPTATITPSPLPPPTLLPTNLPQQTRPLPEITATNTPQPTATPQPTFTPSPLPLPAKVVLDGLEIIPQRFNNCGPANLTMVLNFYGQAAAQESVAAILKPNPEDRNVSPWQIVDYVHGETDLQARAFSGGTLPLLKRLIAAGFPVVIEKGYDLDTEKGWYGHYLTLYGYDDLEGHFYGKDTFLGPWDNAGSRESYEFIENYWQHFNYTFWLVYRIEQEQQLLNILGNDLLEPVTMWEEAAATAKAELEIDPNDNFAWFNLGASLTRLGEISGELTSYQSAAAAFDKARTIGLPPRVLWYSFTPYIAYMKVGRIEDMLTLAEATLASRGGQNVEESYFYQGHALALQGDLEGARIAYEQALSLNANFYPAQIAIDSLP